MYGKRLRPGLQIAQRVARWMARRSAPTSGWQRDSTLDAHCYRTSPMELLPMKKVTITLPSWIRQDEAQDMVVRDLRSHALLKLEFYRSKMKPFEAKYATTFPRFQW